MAGRKYFHDNLYRLIEEQITDSVNGNYAASYQYDNVGNRVYETIDGVSTAYSYDANDRLTQTGGKTFEYDHNGNTLSEALDGVTTSYTYNSQNQLVETTKDGITTTYRYNAEGIRTAQGNGTTETTYVVDQNRDYAQVLLEANTAESNTESVLYTYGDDLISQNRSGSTSYYHYDGLGSTRALSDASGSLKDTYAYEAFGTLLNQTGETENNYLFTGEQYDPNLNQYYLRARYYNQTIGRFTQQDTWMEMNHDPVTLHKYLYANSDPILYTDPSGNMGIGFASTMSAVRVMGTLATIAIRSPLISGAGSTVRAAALTCMTQGIMSVMGVELPHASQHDASNRGCEMNRMRVQLQQGHAYTISKVAVAIPATGVTSTHLRAKLNQLYYARSDASWFPGALDQWMYQSIVSLSIEIGKWTLGGGVSIGGNIMRRETYHRNKEYRIDIENLRGHNLRR